MSQTTQRGSRWVSPMPVRLGTEALLRVSDQAGRIRKELQTIGAELEKSAQKARVCAIGREGVLGSARSRSAIVRLSVSSSKVSKSGTPGRHLLRALESRYDAALEGYPELFDLCERSVVRWVWATAPRYNLDPLFFLNSDLRVGQIVLGPPKDPRGYAAYGFSRENRIVTERQYPTDLEGVFYKGLYRNEADRTTGYYFHYDMAVGCVNCSELVFEASAPTCFQRWAQMGSVSCTYITVDRKIRSFTELFREGEGPQQRLSGELRYVDSGRVEVWTSWPGAPAAKRTFSGVPPAENPFLR